MPFIFSFNKLHLSIFKYILAILISLQFYGEVSKVQAYSFDHVLVHFDKRMKEQNFFKQYPGSYEHTQIQLLNLIMSHHCQKTGPQICESLKFHKFKTEYTIAFDYAKTQVKHNWKAILRSQKLRDMEFELRILQNAGITGFQIIFNPIEDINAADLVFKINISPSDNVPEGDFVPMCSSALNIENGILQGGVFILSELDDNISHLKPDLCINYILSQIYDLSPYTEFYSTVGVEFVNNMKLINILFYTWMREKENFPKTSVELSDLIVTFFDTYFTRYTE